MSASDTPAVRSRRPSATRLGIRLALALVVMAVGYVASRNGWIDAEPAPSHNNTRQEPVSPATKTEQAEAETPVVAELTAPTPAPKETKRSKTTIRDVVIRDEQGGVVYRGDVDIAPTLERIAKDKRLRFRNDGSVFQNRERRLPKQTNGYYQEWVHPTPKLPGPGPQRIVTGEQGEIYYTPDHYKTFQRIE